MTASRLTEVGAGDPQPLELGGIGEHPLEQLPVGGLERRSLSKRVARSGDPHCQRVANLLQLAEADQPRLGRGGRNRRVEREARECLARQPGQLALEAADLPPQLGTGETLVALDANLSEGVSVEQFLHDPI